MKNLIKLLTVLIFSIILSLLIRSYLIEIVFSPTGSMEPTAYGYHIIDKDKTHKNIINKLLNRILYSFREIDLKDTYKNNSILGEFVNNLRLNNNLDLDSKIIISQGDHKMVNKFIYLFKSPNRGDIIIFSMINILSEAELPQKTIDRFSKRIIGLPGDKIFIKDNMIYIKENNKDEFIPIVKLDQKFKKLYSKGITYSAVGLLKNKQIITVPENAYFVLGDNTSISYDSRYWGFVPRENIIGRAEYIVWPFSNRWGKLL